MSTEETGKENHTGQPEKEALEEAAEAEEAGTDTDEAPEKPEPSRDEELESARQEAGEARADMLRMQAETENTRKRLTRELERSRKLALERVMKDLLQVRDSLERGLETDPETATAETVLEGQELTLKMLSKVLEDHDLEEIDPVGQPFDPELHEAMTVLPSPDHDENTVLEVLQKGYRLHDRLIRPAMVVVSSKP